MSWLLTSHADCPTMLASQSWVANPDLLPMIALVMLPLGLTLGAAAVLYGLFGEEQ